MVIALVDHVARAVIAGAEGAAAVRHGERARRRGRSRGGGRRGGSPAAASQRAGGRRRQPPGSPDPRAGGGAAPRARRLRTSSCAGAPSSRTTASASSGTASRRARRPWRGCCKALVPTLDNLDRALEAGRRRRVAARGRRADPARAAVGLLEARASMRRGPRGPALRSRAPPGARPTSRRPAARTATVVEVLRKGYSLQGPPAAPRPGEGGQGRRRRRRRRPGSELTRTLGASLHRGASCEQSEVGRG